VRAFVSQVHIPANLAVELFLFEPREPAADAAEGADDE
jgi:hypothetical protein